TIKLLREIIQPFLRNCRPQIPHERLVVVKIVQRGEARAQYLVRLLQMAQVRARVIAAGVTIAGRIDRAGVCRIAAVADLDVARAGIEPAVARIARRQHAVEHIHAATHRLDQIFRRTGAHEIPRPVARHARSHVLDDPPHRLLRLADRQPPDRVTVKTDLLQSGERSLPQAWIHSALNNSEERAGRVAMGEARTLRPAQRQLHRRARLVLGGRIGRAFVEYHKNVGTEPLLHRDRFLGPEKYAVAVHRRLEVHALLRHLAQRAEAEHLETAGIRENRAFPMHEAMQPAVRADNLDSRAQHQMKRVAENDLRPDIAQLLRRHRLDRAVGADRHERGRFDDTALEDHAPAPRRAVIREQLEFHEGIECNESARPASTAGGAYLVIRRLAISPPNNVAGMTRSSPPTLNQIGYSPLRFSAPRSTPKSPTRPAFK